MHIKDLILFIDVMRRGSFAAVARDRDIDPSSVSRAIANLEVELGVRLFQRTTRRLVPTEAGRIYFERVEPLVNELEHAKHAATDVSAAPVGTLRMTTSVSFGQACILRLLPELFRRYPTLQIELLLTDANLDLIEERIDLAIRLGPCPDVFHIGKKLFDTYYYVVASPSYIEQIGPVLKPSDLIEHKCLLFALPNYRSKWKFKDKKGVIEEVPVKGQLIISNALALRQAALDSLGPALLANWLIDTDLKNGTLVNLFPDHHVTATDFNTAAWLLYPSRSYLPLKVRVVLNFLSASF
jgi:DNA-binding transcriptional LysR family regulator